jgi:multidrug efflux pump
MTSIAFIAGTIPLILGHGAGAEVRGVTGITVFSGMLGVTLFGLFLTPVFYVTLRKFVTRGKKRKGTFCPRRDVADNKKPPSQ